MRHAFDAEPTRLRMDERLARLAARQHGVFARTQATELGATRGMIDHRLEVRRWERLGRSVYRLAGSPPSWRQDLMSACLNWGKGAVASHRASAPLFQLRGFDPGHVELTIPLARRRAGPGIVHRNRLLPSEITAVDGIPVTTPARTLLDLAAVVPIGVVEEAIDDALRRGVVTLHRLWRQLRSAGGQGRPGTAALRRLLGARDPAAPVPESTLERRLMRALMRAGLPPLVPQYEIRVGAWLVARVDFAHPDAKLAIEADGFRWHSGRVAWDHDRARRNELTLLGWRVIHVTWTDLTQRPETAVAAIMAALKVDP